MDLSESADSLKITCLPDDALLEILTRTRPFEPVLRHVCRRWRRLCVALGRAPGRPAAHVELARMGAPQLAIWARLTRGAPFSLRCANAMLAQAAESCNGDVFAVIMAWPETEPSDVIMPSRVAGEVIERAGRAGHTTLANQACVWRNAAFLREKREGRGGVFALIANDGAADQAITAASTRYAARPGTELFMRTVFDVSGGS